MAESGNPLGVAESESGRYCTDDIYEAFEGSDVPKEVQQIAERQLVSLGSSASSPSRSTARRTSARFARAPTCCSVALQGPERSDIETLLDWAMEEFSFDMDDLDDLEIIEDVDVADIDDKDDDVD